MFFDRDFGGGGRRPFPSMDPGSQARFPGFGARDRSMPGFDEFANRHPMFGRNSPFEDTFENGFPRRERSNSGNSSNGSGKNGSSVPGKEHVIPIKVIHTKSEPSEQRPNMAQPSNPEPNQPGESSSADIPDKGRKQTYSQQRNTSEIPHPKVNELNTQRNQRAQSAPPGTEAESVVRQSPPPQANPTAEPPNVTQLGGKTSKSQQGPTANGVRHIPIFVEGRKGPVVNGNCHPGNAKPKGPVIEEEKTQQSSNECKSSRSTPEEAVPPKKQALPKSPLEKIQEVLDDVKALAEKVEAFNGTFKDKDYLYLDEMLTRDLIKLDLIETEGKEEIRLARKNCIKEITNTIAKLETKAKLATAPDNKVDTTNSMEVEEAKTESSSILAEDSSNPQSINANLESTPKESDAKTDASQPEPVPQESDHATSDTPMETDPNETTMETSSPSATPSKPEESK